MNKATAVVTGASSGLGKAIYEHLKDHGGYNVIGISRRGPDMYLDLTHRHKSISDCKFPWGDDFGRIDVLINCAGIMPLEEKGMEEDIFNVNFWAVYRALEDLYPYLRVGSSVINIASISGIIGEKDLPIYAASKAALISLTKSYAKKWAGSIRVNSISPGLFKTNLVPGEPPQELIDTIPLGYAADSKEILPVVDMLLHTPYMTGSNIVIDGGATL